MKKGTRELHIKGVLSTVNNWVSERDLRDLIISEYDVVKVKRKNEKSDTDSYE